jgi:hypothetical protein
LGLVPSLCLPLSPAFFPWAVLSIQCLKLMNFSACPVIGVTWTIITMCLSSPTTYPLVCTHCLPIPPLCAVRCICHKIYHLNFLFCFGAGDWTHTFKYSKLCHPLL